MNRFTAALLISLVMLSAVIVSVVSVTSLGNAIPKVFSDKPIIEVENFYSSTISTAYEDDIYRELSQSFQIVNLNYRSMEVSELNDEVKEALKSYQLLAIVNMFMRRIDVTTSLPTEIVDTLKSYRSLAIVNMFMRKIDIVGSLPTRVAKAVDVLQLAFVNFYERKIMLAEMSSAIVKNLDVGIYGVVNLYIRFIKLYPGIPERVYDVLMGKPLPKEEEQGPKVLKEHVQGVPPNYVVYVVEGGNQSSSSYTTVVEEFVSSSLGGMYSLDIYSMAIAVVIIAIAIVSLYICLKKR